MNELDDLLAAIDMEWLLQREGVTYKESYGRSGRQLNIRECPFCHHAQYKVYMGAESGIGNCFSGSCPKQTFNKWSFIKGLFDCTSRETINLLKELAREQGWRPKIAALPGLQDLNTLDLPPSTQAWSMSPMPEYLVRRSITPEIAEYFSLHWSPDGKHKYMDPRGFELAQDYSNRILLPIFDIDGEMVSFQGRDTTGEHEQRYLFPPGFASAGAYLYNGVNVEDGTETIVIAEGVFDVIAVKRALDLDDRTKAMIPIGTFGMHLSTGDPSGDDQIGRLRRLKVERGVKHLIFLWDGEQKAFAAAIVAALNCVGIGFKCSIGFIPDGKDPGNSRVAEITDAVLNALPIRTPLDALKILRKSKTYRTL